MMKPSTTVATHLRWALLPALVGGLALGGVPAVYATQITVTTTTDELNADGDCSLREAIVAANTNTAVDACPAGSGADTITLPAGTFTLSLAGINENAAATGDLDIVDDL
ncbi:MAG: CSLREA domain-containing protein, partial [Anaerolineales bacterium]|nr:CSLREA domain-containing protein [Anaerolineales bacterium]